MSKRFIVNNKSGTTQLLINYWHIFVLLFLIVGCLDDSPTSTEAKDTTAPQSPANVIAETGDKSVLIAWNKGDENDLNGYNIYRKSQSNAIYTKINSSLIPKSTNPSYLDTSGLVNGTTYFYVVTAVDDSGNESDNSVEVSAVPGIKTGSLSVASIPSGAKILINSVFTGEVTPYTFSGYPVGEYVVSVSLDDYSSPDSKTVSVASGETSQVSFSLSQQVGSYSVTSSPSGASIVVDGVDTGQVTPYTFSDIPVGSYSVAVVLDGYGGGDSRQVMVADGEPSTVEFSLSQDVGGILVTSAPSGAEIFIDGETTGQKTPHTFTDYPPGEYTVSVSLDGYAVVVPQSVTVVGGQESSVEFTLSQSVGGFQVTSSPSGASIVVDGVDTGQVTPYTFSDIPVGSYSVAVVLDGYGGGDSRQVTVADGEPSTVEFSLSQDVGGILVMSVPSGAEIFIDGETTGQKTPHTFTDYPPGEYTVSVSLDGYAVVVPQSVTVVGGQESSVEFTLSQSVGGFRVTSSPSGASIVVDGVDTGQVTPYTFSDIPVGSYSVAVVLDGYGGGDSRQVTVADGEPSTVEFSLSQDVGGILVMSVPSGADILIDGEATGHVTPHTFSDYAVGEYTVSVSLVGYAAVVPQSVTVSSGLESSVEFTLSQSVGGFRVTSSPSGASIIVDGVDTGQVTPFTFSDIPVGSYSVAVVLDGYGGGDSRQVTVADGEPSTVEFSLSQDVGSILVTSAPSGAEIFIDGEATGHVTPHTFSDYPVGEYTVSVSLVGYAAVVPQSVTVSSGQESSVEFTLSQSVGGFQVTSSPSGASIVVDGVDTGQVTPYTFSDIPVGSYSVAVVLDGYGGGDARQVTVTDGQPSKVEFSLSQRVGSFTVSSSPSGADIIVNGVNTGQVTPHTFNNQPIGSYSVSVDLEGYGGGDAQQIVVSEVGTKTVSFSLSRQLGNLQISSSPSGASIFLDGVDTGQVTPYTFSDIPVGTYNVAVVIDGYGGGDTRQVTVGDGDTETVPFSLSQQVGSFQVTSSPSGAAIFLDGVDTGRVTPYTFNNQPIGSYSVSVDLEGYGGGYSQQVVVSEGGTKNVSFSLVQLLGSIKVTSSLVGAKIFLDGVDTGFVTPYTFRDIPVGSYSVDVSFSCYSSGGSQAVVVSSGEIKTAEFSLVQLTYTISGTISGASGVTVTLSGDASDSQSVNSGGRYSFTVGCGGNYTVTPSKAGYTFSLSSKSFKM